MLHMGDIELRSDRVMTAKKVLGDEKSEENDGHSRYQRYEMIRDDIIEQYGDKLDNRQIGYLAALAVTGKKGMSAKMAGVSYNAIRQWRSGRKNKFGFDYSGLFKELEEMSEDIFNDLLLSEVDRRALEGVKQDIFYKGEKVGEKHKYSDNLLMFRVKGRMPEYKDSSLNIKGGAGGDINISFELPDMETDIIDGDTLEEGDYDE